jgi:hypothetical protein
LLPSRSRPDHPRKCATKLSNATQYADACTTSMPSTRVPDTASVDIQYKRKRCLWVTPVAAIATTDQRYSTTLVYCQILDTRAVHFHPHFKTIALKRRPRNFPCSRYQRRSLECFLPTRFILATEISPSSAGHWTRWIGANLNWVWVTRYTHEHGVSSSKGVYCGILYMELRDLWCLVPFGMYDHDE